MKIGVRLSGLLLLALVSRAARAEELNEALEKAIKLTEEITTALASVKDESGAKKSRPAVDRFVKQLGELKDSIEDASTDKRLLPRVEDLSKSMKALGKEVNRLDTNAKTYKVFRDSPLFLKLRKAKEQKARLDVVGLATQLDIYKLNNGNYPDKIDALAEKQLNGAAPLVKPETLLDPWGQKYKLDPAGKKNRGQQCDVWSVGHPIEKKAIGNWSKGAAKEKPGKE